MTQSKGTILTVDDEWMVREMITEIFAELGYTVLQAENPSEALPIIKSYQTEKYEKSGIDCVLSDNKMPGEGEGLAMIRQVRTEIGYQGPIHMVSGTPHPDLEKEILLFTGNPIIDKPFDVPSLIKKVEDSIETYKK